MASFWEILSYIKISLFLLIIVGNIIYSIPIIFVRRLHIRYNILTLNVCLASMSCAIYWLIFSTMGEFNSRLLYRENTCQFLLYMQLMVVFQASYSIVLISVNQLCDIVYHTKRFFITNKWLIICLASQWIAGSILSIPSYARIPWVRIERTILSG